MKIRPVHGLLLVTFLVCVSAALYLPWRDNPLVFDDLNLLKSMALMDFATTPFSFSTRQFPYFTLAFESVVSDGNLHVSRYVSLVLHGLNASLLFLLAQRLLARALTPRRAFITALLLAIAFVVHPVAVYGVAYLIQRTVLLATFFLLLSAWQFEQSLTERSWRRAMIAGICFGLAAMSKEHAITGFIAVLGIVLIDKTPDWHKVTLTVLAFLCVALPFALWVLTIKLGYVGTVYEPDAQSMISAAGFPDAGSRLGNWLLSAELQCRFFFRYLGLWWWPDPAGMSIDIRPDFGSLSRFPLILLGPAAFVAMAGGIAFTLTSKRVRPELKLTAFGLLWAMSLFLVELSTVRFQEAIVLYRSYLWSPGLLLALAGLVSLIPARTAATLATVAILAMLPISWGRLDTFSDGLKLWQEAAVKLPQATTPGAIRIRFNLGLFQARARQLDKAQGNFEWIKRQDPQSYLGYWGLSGIHIARGDQALAADELNTVIRLKPDYGPAYFRQGMLLQKMGKDEESEAALNKAETLGMPHFEFK